MFEGIEKTKKRNVLATVLGVFVLLAAITGVAVAYYTWVYTSSNANTIGTGKISMTLLESTDVINIADALPMSDSAGKTLPSSKSFDFAVTTSADGAPGTINYTIYITKVAPTTGYTRLEDSQVKLYLQNTTDEEDAKAPTLASNLTAFTGDGIANSLTLATDSHTHATTNTTTTTNYRLKMWVDYGVNASNWDESTKLEYKVKIGVKGDLVVE